MVGKIIQWIMRMIKLKDLLMEDWIDDNAAW